MSDPTGTDTDPFVGCYWRDDRGVEVMNVSQARAIAARVRAEAVAGVLALADDFHERGQSHVLATDVQRAKREAWMTAARKLRAALPGHEEGSDA